MDKLKKALGAKNDSSPSEEVNFASQVCYFKNIRIKD